jgi:hypothetical protein
VAAKIEAAAEIGAIFFANSGRCTGCPYQSRCPPFLFHASGLDGGEPSSPSEQNPSLGFYAPFAWLITHQPAILFSRNKPATSNLLSE